MIVISKDEAGQRGGEQGKFSGCSRRQQSLLSSKSGTVGCSTTTTQGSQHPGPTGGRGLWVRAENHPCVQAFLDSGFPVVWWLPWIDHDGVSCQVLRSSRCGQTQMPPIRAGSDMSLGAGVEERALVAYNQALSPSCLRRTSLECLWT